MRWERGRAACLQAAQHAQRWRFRRRRFEVAPSGLAAPQMAAPRLRMSLEIAACVLLAVNFKPAG